MHSEDSKIILKAISDLSRMIDKLTAYFRSSLMLVKDIIPLYFRDEMTFQDCILIGKQRKQKAIVGNLMIALGLEPLAVV